MYTIPQGFHTQSFNCALTFLHRVKLAPQVCVVLKAPRDKEERPVTWEEQDQLVSE